jgi:hypothetical protein
MKPLLAAALFSATLLAHAPAYAERLCGWLEATSLGPNWKNNYDRLFLSDRTGHHPINEDGGNLPDLSDPAVHRGEIIRDRDVNYLYAEGWSGNFCACMTVRTDHYTIVEFRHFKIQKLAVCRADPAIQRFAPR